MILQITGLIAEEVDDFATRQEFNFIAQSWNHSFKDEGL